MTDNLIRRVKASLRSQHYMVNDSWLKDCIEYYISEHANPTQDEVQRFVTAQWQLSDLREINNENGCLPPNLSQNVLTTLPGKYILQMEKMYDISISKFKQLEKIRNVSNDNIEATEMETTQAWEPKKSRMMQLFLTDGIQDVTAIEYKPIRFFKDVLVPGYKMLIIGPVVCRRGVILLEEKCVVGIGGEVESLLIANALENVLARKLNLQENPDPYNDNEQNKQRQEGEDSFFDEDFEIDPKELSQIEELTLSQQNGTARQDQNTSSIVNSRRDISSNDVQSVNIPAPAQGSNGSSRNHNDNTRRPPTFQRHSDISEFPDDDDDLIKLIEEDQIPDNELTREPDLPRNSTNCSKYAKNTHENPIHVLSTKNSTFEKDDVVPMTESFAKPASPNIPDITEFPDDDFDMVPYDDLQDISLPSWNEMKTGISKGKELNSSMENQCKTSSSRVANINLEEPCTSSNASKISRIELNNKGVKSLTSNERYDKPVPSVSGIKRPASISSPPAMASSKMKCVQKTPKLSKGNKKITDFAQKVALNDEELPKICDFICDILEVPTTDTPTYRTIRGKNACNQKLSKEGLLWCMNVTITDDTASLDITFDSKVVERFLGFSVEEFLRRKKMRKTNPEIDEQLRMALRVSELKVKRMDALLELELVKDEKPKVVNVRELTDEQKAIIDKRIKMLMI